MGNTVALLKIAVAGFLQRKMTDFLRTASQLSAAPLLDAQNNPILDAGGNVIQEAAPAGQAVAFDILLQACNNARLYAERRVDFELSKVSATIPAVDLLNGGSLSTAVLVGTSTPVSIKKILTPFIQMADGTQYAIDLWTKKKWNDRLKARFEAARPTDTSDFAFITDAPFVLVQYGNKVFVAPADSTAFTSPFPVFLDVVSWLPIYVTGTENDFLLDNAFDWMMYRTLYELNLYLKEDERIPINAKFMEDGWQSIVTWNDQLIAANVDDVDLD